MEQLHFAYPWVWYWLVPVLVAAALWVAIIRRRLRYRYALAGYISDKGHEVRFPVRSILFFLRLLSLGLLTMLIARPQWLDTSSSVNIKGVDIVLTIDMSGSMRVFDDLKDRTTRIEAAKREALDFIEMRHNDPIGVVLFGAEAFSKVPLTLDKELLKDVVKDLQLGDVDPNGTAMMTALATAINRLRDSESKSKVIVLLTDGMPSDEELKPDVIINLAKQFGIKVYTLGVGNKDRAYDYDMFGRVTPERTVIDEKLLRSLAQETGGHFFRVYTPADLKKAYAKIDALEKTQYNTTLYHNYYEAFATFIWWILLLFFLELFLRYVVWRGLS
ncbi:MAG: VWA domain-containing protein [Candidatus Dependentiae bacterium]|jgi:Ca-activated chloride channel family protein